MKFGAMAFDVMAIRPHAYSIAVAVFKKLYSACTMHLYVSVHYMHNKMSLKHKKRTSCKSIRRNGERADNKTE